MKAREYINNIEVLETFKGKKDRKYGKFICFCKKEFISEFASVKHGRTKSCGCLLRAKAAKQGKKNVKHGDYGTPLYNVWSNIKQRTINSKHKDYANYGARGIKVCEEWSKSYEKFKKYVLNELGERPNGYSLDRINNDGDYEPGNVRWVCSKVQNSNKRNVKATKEKLEMAQTMRQNGKTLQEIANYFDIGTTTAKRWSET
jgi:hypothetical protein